MKIGLPTRMTDRGFLAVTFLVCGVGALYLLLSPAGRERRAAERAVARLEVERDREWRYNHALERYLHGLQTDPSLIELEARRLGYGRPGERTYALSPADISALSPRPTATALSLRRIARDVIRASLPAFVILSLAGLALFFFTDLRLDPGQGPEDDPEAPNHCERVPT